MAEQAEAGAGGPSPADLAAAIAGLGDLTPGQRERCAVILVEALRHVPSAWGDLVSARGEVATFLAGEEERFALAAVEPCRGDVLGWVGCILQSRHAAELHPLVVDPRRQRGGVGALLVRALEAELRRRGVGAVWLGSDDDFGGTNLFGVDLYPEPLRHLVGLTAAARGHPFTFYRKMGYAVVGVLPDADGPGRHDILMAKRLLLDDDGRG
jgi:aminoglycoside 6'-N-acetyltransferase I